MNKYKVAGKLTSSPFQKPFFIELLKYGVALGTAEVLLFLGAWLMELDLNNPYTDAQAKIVLSFAGMIMTIFIYQLMMIRFRDGEQKGYLSLGQAITIGLILGASAGVVTSIYYFFFASYLNPGVVKSIKDNMITFWQQDGMNQESLSILKDMAEKSLNPFTLALFQMLGSLFKGLFNGFVIGLFVRNEEPKAQ